MSAQKQPFVVRGDLSVSGNGAINSTLTVGEMRVNGTLTTNVLVSNTFTSNSVTALSFSSNTITVNVGSITFLTSNTANINTITTLSGNVRSLSSNTISSNVITSSNGNFTHIVTTNGYANSLTVNNLSVLGNSSLNYETGSTLRSYREYVTVATVSGSRVVNLLDSNIHRLTLSGNTTISLNNAPLSNASPLTLIINRSVANAVITHPGNTVWSEGIIPVQSTGIGQIDIFTYLVLDGGSLIVGAHSFANVS